ncbi:hypothetical protein [Streptomyces endophytica]|uniref:Uncharacterized protein n=1 Tax=Streptomyces endophytica TaxID=2991496 RepID=A0ABY6P7V3_9ACTN|nr:hypothetical protein [Streptomyces endophytica]UZJ29884.1 hypothetical protein OJ254_04810 [Streptomyces endophytica]
MNPVEKLRLLPWSSPDGKPCYLAGDGNGYVSRLADEIETAQLASAAELIEEARRTLDARTWTSGELRLLAVVTASLADVHRVAESRGARLPVPDDDEPDAEATPGNGDDGGPRHPARACG